MIAGAFADAERAASEALDIARTLEGRAGPEAIHATTTLAVVRGWGETPGSAVPLLEHALGRARELGLVEEWWRAGANMAVVLELLGRPGDAVDRAFEGMAEARALDLDAVYGNLMAGNVAGILVDVGRWEEARELSLRALDWSPAGIPFVNAILNLVIVEIESEAGEEAGRLLGRILVELETGGDFQFAVPAYQATASYAMWSGDLSDARRAAERGWARLRGTEDWVLVARMAATALEVESAIVAEALERRRIGDVAASRERAGRILARGEGAVAQARAEGDAVSRGEPEASLATRPGVPRPSPGPGRSGPLGRACRPMARHRRTLSRGAGHAGARPRRSWRRRPRRGGPGARARTDARVVRADAREPLLEAVSLAMRLRARPLLRELRELGLRSVISLPPEVDELLRQARGGRPARGPPISPGPVGRRRPGTRAGTARRRPTGRDARATPSGCRAASWRCSPSSRAVAPTARSVIACSSARRRWASTSATSWPSSGCPDASRRRRLRSALAWRAEERRRRLVERRRRLEPQAAPTFPTSPGAPRGTRFAAVR